MGISHADYLVTVKQLLQLNLVFYKQFALGEEDYSISKSPGIYSELEITLHLTAVNHFINLGFPSFEHIFPCEEFCDIKSLSFYLGSYVLFGNVLISERHCNKSGCCLQIRLSVIFFKPGFCDSLSQSFTNAVSGGRVNIVCIARI